MTVPRRPSGGVPVPRRHATRSPSSNCPPASAAVTAPPAGGSSSAGDTFSSWIGSGGGSRGRRQHRLQRADGLLRRDVGRRLDGTRKRVGRKPVKPRA